MTFDPASLNAFHARDLGSPERCGFVKADGSAIEVPNISKSPVTHYEMSGEAILEHAYAEDTVGTWHTHPGMSCNLGPDDAIGYLGFPHLTHYVTGDDGVAAYRVEDGIVVNA